MFGFPYEETDRRRDRYPRRASAMPLILGLTFLVLPLACCGLPTPHNIAGHWMGVTTAWRQLGTNVPMSVYGKVVDERGRPIEGARVEVVKQETSFFNTMFEGTILQLGSRTPRTRFVLRTDAQGRFSLTDVRGWSLGVAEIKVPGRWRLRDTATNVGDKFKNGSFTFYSPSWIIDQDGVLTAGEYWPYRPHPDHPAVFPMYPLHVEPPTELGTELALPERGGLPPGHHIGPHVVVPPDKDARRREVRESGR